MEAIHQRIKVTYNFEKGKPQTMPTGHTRPPGHRYFKGQIFLKTSPKINIYYIFIIYIGSKTILLGHNLKKKNK